MENASKALIIAGAILLSILIIALGVFIFNQSRNAMSNTGINDQQVQAFNAKFEAYEGTISGAQARTLIELIRTNNNQGDSNSGTFVTMYWGDHPVFTNSDAKNAIILGDTYTVELTYKNSGATRGYVDHVIIRGNFNT